MTTNADPLDHEIERLREAVAAERERCAKICETNAVYYAGSSPMGLVPNKLGDPIGHLFAASIRNDK
jgi:hypothetical protein